MKVDKMIEARKQAQAAVEDMAEGTLKIAAFETILRSLLEERQTIGSPEGSAANKRDKNTTKRKKGGTADRLKTLMDDGFFNEQRSLGDVQAALAERGWHYRQEDLSTPLRRFVRQKHLRRVQATDGQKKLWKYSMY